MYLFIDGDITVFLLLSHQYCISQAWSYWCYLLNFKNSRFPNFQCQHPNPHHLYLSPGLLLPLHILFSEFSMWEAERAL